MSWIFHTLCGRSPFISPRFGAAPGKRAGMGRETEREWRLTGYGF